jgi:hypothetical protein
MRPPIATVGREAVQVMTPRSRHVGGIGVVAASDWPRLTVPQIVGEPHHAARGVACAPRRHEGMTERHQQPAPHHRQRR